MNEETYRICKLILGLLFVAALVYVGNQIGGKDRYQFHKDSIRVIDTRTGDTYYRNEGKVHKNTLK